MKYKNFVKTHNKLIKEAQSIYYKNSFDSKIHGAKELWKQINNLYSFNSKNTSRQSHVAKLLINNNVITNNDDIAQHFNDYFCNVGKSLVDKLASTPLNRSFRDYLPRPISNSFVCEHISHIEMYNIINKLSTRKSAGPDTFNIQFLSNYQPILIPILCYIFNLSLEQGIYPSALKVAKTIPIYKKGTHACLSNYRPISLLSIFSKIFESLMATRLSLF